MLKLEKIYRIVGETMQNLSKLAKKTLSVFLATVLVLSCFSSALGVVASAADEIGEPWDGTTATQPAQAEDGYYLISNGAELAWLRNQVVNNVDRSINGRLTANINLDNKVWEPIGNNSRQYAGTFDGQGYTISNLTVTSTSVDRGLFGKITTSAVIKNININDVTITTVRDYAGGVVGVAVGGTISNCHVKGINIATTKAYVGGIVGYVSGATVISGCTVTGTSSMKTLSGSAYIGGILGEIRANNVVISDCVVDNLNISGTSSDTRIAGAVGNAAYRFSMYDCLVKNVNVTGVKKVGGLAFVIRTGSVIERCGVIDSTLTATQTSASTDTEIGGLIAVVTDSTINTVQYCYVYNTTVSTYGRVSGGFIGKVETARHILSENYCAAELILKASPTRAGSLIGWASTGEYNDMYYVPNGSQAYIGEKASAAVLNNVASITDSEAKNGTLLNNLNARTNIWKEGDDGYPVIDRLLAAEPATDENGVYLIATAYHLEWFRKHVNSGNTTKNARLIADIDLNNKRIEPIGADSVRYAGIFDGDGFIISNLNMLTPGSYRGLFGSTTPTAVIKNLNLKNVYIDTNGDFVGSAVGMLRGRAENITVEGVNVTANAKAGGVVGEMQNGAVISNVSVQGTETANIIKTTSTNVGGVVGNIYTSASYVNNAVAKNLNITGTERVSGIAGDVSTNGSSVGHFDTVLVEDVNITATSRYAGGVVFNLRNASTVTRATIRNVRITGSAQIGGITGTTAGDGGKITDSLVENYTGVSTGEETGGIVGYINSKTTITDTIIKDSSITGKRYLGGVSYTLKNGSVLSRVGVINVTVTATDTSTSNEQRVGGLIGYVTGSPANTVQYCYVTDTSVSSTGRMTGGFIGYSGSSAHFITENYANAEVITTGKIYAGSFLGRRSTGNFLDNFSTLTSGTTLVGSATAGVAGDATGISEVPMSDVRNGNLVNTLNAITDVWAQINDDYVNGYPVISKAQPPELVDGYYEITNTFQLEWFRNQVNNFGELTANAKLMTDLNLNGKEWVPIANNSSRYNGTFDGQGYSISNFRITNNSSYLGLFGAINTAAVIKDLAINNVKITSTGSYVGGVVGMSKGRTENITVEGVDISANTRAGGVIGEMRAGASAANLTVLGTEGANSITTSSTHAGGVIGSAYNSTFYLNNITAKNLVVRGNERTGGIMGDIHNEGTSIAHFDTVLVENVSVTSTARYSGGVLFNLRNGSSMTNATVRNVTVTATEEVGGIAGAVGGSGTSTLSNSVVENFTGVASGEKAGGLVGTLNIKLIVSDCIVKDSSVTAKRYLGGIAYTLYNGSTATRVGVINTEINATDTSSSNEQRIGGLFGVLNGTAVTLQYSYIIDSTIKATAGTRIGGAIGTSITNNHTVRYNYVANTSVSPRNAYSGSFLGNRSTGTFTSNFVYNCSDLPLVGSSTAGNAGNVTGVSKVEIFADDIPSAETATLINYYTANKGFIDSFENADVAFLKDEVFSDVYNELLEVLSEIRAELSARLDAEIQVLRDLYDEFDMVCIFNYEMIGLNLGTVTTDIATKIDLLPETQENYDFYLWLVNEYNTYLANHGYNSFYEATVGFMPRLVRENDIARYESPRDDFPVTYEKMQNVVNKLDALLLGEDFATLAGLDSDISGMIKETLQEELYTDEMVNDLMGNIYPAFIEALEEAIEENARIDIGVTTISLRGKARDILEDLLDKFGFRVYPHDLAGAIDSKYASIKSILSSAGEDWSKVNFEDPDSPKYLHWGITDKDSFIDAFANSLAGIYPVLRAALTRNAFDQKKSSSVIANIDVEVRLRISAVDAYDKAVLPLFEMINVTGFMPADEYNGITNVKGLISNVFDPLLTFIEEELPSAPFSNLMEILPNIAHCLEFGLVESWLKTLKTKVSYDINGVFDYWLGDIDFNITDGTYDFDVYEMLSEDEDGILYGADLSSLTGLVKILTNFLDVDVELPPINSKYLASLGTVVQLDSATRNLTRYYIMGDSAKVSYVALKYIFELLGNEDFIKAVIEEFGDEEDLEDIDEKLNGTIGDIARNIAANPYDAIAAIAELCNPVEYEVRSLDYGNPLDGEFAKVTYSQYWTKQQATYVSDHLDEYINDILKLFGMKPAGEILREKLGELYTNDTLTSLIIGAREALDELDEDDKILTVLDVDISPWDEIEEGYDWGFADGDKDGFLAALCAALSPLNNAVGLFLADMDYTIMDGEITVKGYNGYQTAIVPLLEALGCDYEDILTGDEYLAAVAQDPNSMIELIIRPIFELLERVYAAPTETLFSILPNLIYFLESGVLDTAILNMVQPILVVIDTIRPIYDIEFEFSARDFVVEAINDLALENGITLPDINLSDMLKAYAATRTNVHGEEIYVIDADNADVMTVMLRYIVTTLFCPDNIGLIKTALVDESGLTGNNAAVLKAIIDSFADLINAPDGADKVLGSLYFIFKGSEQGFGEANDFLDNFNHYWTEFLNMLSGSESEYIRGFADAVKALLSQYLDGVIDEGGLAPNGIVKFFQSIAEFFRNFFDMIRNLFR